MRKLSYDPKKVLELYKQGKNDNEIAKELKCRANAIYDFRKKNNLSSNFQYKCNIEDRLKEIKKLKEQGLGNRKISKLLDIPRSSLMYLFRKHNLENIEYVPKYANLDKFQYSALIGSLLGDSSISKKNILNIGHGLKQEEYYKHKILLFSPNINFLEYRIEKLDKRTNNIYTSLQAYSNKYEDIVELRNKFYPEGVKVITEEILKDFNEISLAYLFMDDGNYEKYGAKIALCNFTNNEIKIFQTFLHKKWNIVTSKHKDNSIYIKAISRKKFIELVFPYIIPSMMYKIN